MQVSLGLASLQSAYAKGHCTPSSLIGDIYPLLEEERECFIAVASLHDLKERCRILEDQPVTRRGVLWGVPFAVKDNIDVEGFDTTAACPAFAYQPQSTAVAVSVLLDEGGIMVGKTNMDQFAAGLVGTRTPYGTARNAFDDRFVPGGSSSGSGVLVGSGLVSFALGTDTAGSGRVPAMLNGCVGIKPTVRRVSSQGVVPACRSLDCISCFARTVEDGVKVVKLMERAGSLEDPCWRPFPSLVPRRPSQLPQQAAENGSHLVQRPSREDLFCNPKFRFGVPSAKYLVFDGPGGTSTAALYQKAFQEAIERAKSLNGELVPINFGPFCKIAQLLYASAFVAERYAGIRHFVETKQNKSAVSRESVEADERMEKVTAAIVAQGTQYSAADVYEAFATLSELAAQARAEMSKSLLRGPNENIDSSPRYDARLSRLYQ